MEATSSAEHFRAKQIFLETIQQPSEEAMAAFLEQRCQGDTALRREVNRLIAAYQSPDSLLDQADLREQARSRSTPLNPGQKVGPYVIRELIGEGGMGLVYRAEQFEPFQRLVALKIIKPGLDTREVLRRFQMEQQTLASLHHANVASVLDAGQTDSGHSYFAMELVPGDPVTEFCDRHNLDIARRLELFRQICAAVTHAHQKGVIHRDLKPWGKHHEGRSLPSLQRQRVHRPWDCSSRRDGRAAGSLPAGLWRT